MMKIKGKIVILFSLILIMGFCPLMPNLNNNQKVSATTASEITMTPTVSTFVTTKKEYDDFLLSKERPDVIFFECDKDLNIILSEGELTVKEVVDYKKANVTKQDGIYVPAFIVKTNDTAIALGQYLNVNLSDCFVVSEDATLVKTTRNIAKKISGLIDLRTAEKMSVKEIRAICNTNMAKTVLLGNNNIEKEKVFSLQKLLVTVWAYSDGDKINEYKAISSGANGVSAKDVNSLQKTLSSFDERTLIRTPLLIGHRGLPSLLPENTLEGAREAVKNGADAIENDLYLTLDKQIVISHDSSLRRTTNYDGPLDISEMTLAEIKKLEISGANGEKYKVPTLEEFFNEFKGKGIIHFTEIKDTNLAVIDEVAKLIKKCDVSDEVVFICFDRNALLKCKELMPEISVGYLNSIPVVGDYDYQTTVKTMEMLNADNFTCNTILSLLNPERVKMLNDRGITCWPWTYSGKKELINAFFSGINGLTANNVHDMYDFGVDIKVDKYVKIYLNKENESPFAVVTKNKNEKIQKAGELVKLSGDDLQLTYKDGKVSAKTEGTGVYYFKTKYGTIGASPYWLYSEPFTIETGIEPEKGCSCDSKKSASVGGIMTLLCVGIMATRRFFR